MDTHNLKEKKSMTTKTNTRPAETLADPTDPEALHRVNKKDMAFSIATGVQVPAICGEWMHCDEPGAPGALNAGGKVCRRCEEIYETLPA